MKLIYTFAGNSKITSLSDDACQLIASETSFETPFETSFAQNNFAVDSEDYYRASGSRFELKSFVDRYQARAGSLFGSFSLLLLAACDLPY